MQVYDFAEFFAGEAKVTAEVKKSNYRAVCLDLVYDTEPGHRAMDINTPAGFAPFGYIYSDMWCYYA